MVPAVIILNTGKADLTEKKDFGWLRAELQEPSSPERKRRENQSLHTSSSHNDQHILACYIQTVGDGFEASQSNILYQSSIPHSSCQGKQPISPCNYGSRPLGAPPTHEEVPWILQWGSFNCLYYCLGLHSQWEQCFYDCVFEGATNFAQCRNNWNKINTKKLTKVKQK